MRCELEDTTIVLTTLPNGNTIKQKRCKRCGMIFPQATLFLISDLSDNCGMTLEEKEKIAWEKHLERILDMEDLFSEYWLTPGIDEFLYRNEKSFFDRIGGIMPCDQGKVFIRNGLPILASTAKEVDFFKNTFVKFEKKCSIFFIYTMIEEMGNDVKYFWISG